MTPKQHNCHRSSANRRRAEQRQQQAVMSRRCFFSGMDALLLHWIALGRLPIFLLDTCSIGILRRRILTGALLWVRRRLLRRHAALSI